MNLNNKFKALLLIVVLCVVSCNKGPKMISSFPANENSKNSTNDNTPQSKTKSNSTSTSELHTVIVNEVLKTSKYLYINVNEKGEQFWIATRSMDVVVGETYHYKGGLLKTNYESKEHQRVFEKIYLVSNRLVHANHGTNSNLNEGNKLATKQEEIIAEPVPIVKPSKKIEIKGSLKISELVKNFIKYEGQIVQISGVCVKINFGIMGRNWIHLKDGSSDDYDLVITSNALIKEDEVITMKAKVSLNKDFGAGYKYELILEDGILIP